MSEAQWSGVLGTDSSWCQSCREQRVLLVDDDESHRAHCAAALRSVGLDVIEAGGVREAHASAVREQPHLIVIHLKPETADLV